MVHLRNASHVCMLNGESERSVGRSSTGARVDAQTPNG
jgi:hypothetical protein